MAVYAAVTVAVVIGRTAAATSSTIAALTVIGLTAVVTLPSSSRSSGTAISDPPPQIAQSPPTSSVDRHSDLLAPERSTSVVRLTDPSRRPPPRPAIDVWTTRPPVQLMDGSRWPTASRRNRRPKDMRKDRSRRRESRRDKKRNKRRRKERKQKENRRTSTKRKDDERRGAGYGRENVENNGKRLRKNQHFLGGNKVCADVDSRLNPWPNDFSPSTSPPSPPIPSPVPRAQTDGREDVATVVGGFTGTTLLSLLAFVSLLVAVLCGCLWWSRAAAAGSPSVQLFTVDGTRARDAKTQPVYTAA